jgi:hypothetical protein
MEPEGSLPCSQELSTGLYPEPDQSHEYHPVLSLLRSSVKVLLVGTFLLALLFTSIHATCPSHPILLDLIILIIIGEEYKL